MNDSSVRWSCSISCTLQIPFGNDKIYEGSNISCADALLMVLAFISRYQLSKVCTQSLLDLFNCLIPGCVPRNNYYLDILTKANNDEIIRHYYCNSCNSLVGVIKKVTCPHCHSALEKDRFFLQLPIKQQLQSAMNQFYMFRNTDPIERKSAYSDISSGLKYEEVGSQWFSSNPDNVTLNWSTDGVPIFKSSKFSIWPVCVTINELQYEVRNRCPILCFLWFGSDKPEMNMFLEPFVQLCTDLESVGFNWNDAHGLSHNTKALTLACSCDTVARPMLQNIKQFNGYYGCGFCLHTGEYLKDDNVMVYPLMTPLPQSRTHRATIKDAENAVKAGKAINGVKGPSVLALLPRFNLIDSFVPDCMHSVLLGIVRQFVSLWFDTKNSTEPFYIGKRINEVDSKLLAIKSPVEVRRPPRSIKERKFWKASEWRSFLLLYSVIVLNGILPSPYFEHWCLLVYAFQCLQSPALPRHDLDSIDLALCKFQRNIAVHYGKRHTSYNSHLLTHVCEAVKKFGLPWAWSCFVFESFYGKLQKKFHGTQNVALQIAKNVMLDNKLSVLANKNFNDPPDNVVNIYENLTSWSVFTQKHTALTKYCSAFGRCRYDILCYEEMLAIRKLVNAGPLEITQAKMLTFQRFILHGTIYNTIQYCANFKRKNCDIFTTLNNEGIFGSIKKFGKLYICNCDIMKICNCDYQLIVIIEAYKASAELIFDPYVETNILNFLHKVINKTPQLIAFSVDDNTNMCKSISIPRKDELFLMKLPFFKEDN